jgi:hypothetical protein
MNARLIVLLVFVCALALQFGAALENVGFHEGGF